MLEEKNVEEQVVLAQGEEEATSPVAEEVQEQEGAAPSAEEEDVTPEVQEPTPLHEHPRFKEVIEEKNYWRQQAETLARPKQEPQQQQQQQVMGATPEEREFYRQRQEESRRIAREEFEKANQKTQAQIQAAQQEFARIKVGEFRRSHPDIKQDSQEESEIARKINIGYSPDDAYWSVMGPKGIKNVQQKAVKQVKQQLQVKKKANSITTGVETTGLPPTQVSKDSFRKDLEKEMEGAEL